MLPKCGQTSAKTHMDKRRLAFGTLASGFANAFKVCLQFVMLPLMARLLGPNEFGLYALAMPTIMFVMMLADGGLGASLAREPEDNAIVWSSAFWAILGAAIVLGVGVIIWSFPMASLAHQPRLPPIMATLSACLVLYALGVPSGARLLRQAKLITAATADMFANVVGAACAIALAVSGAGVWSMVAQSVVTYSVKLIIMFAVAPVVPKLKFSFSELRSHLTIGGAIVGSKLVDSGDRVLENALVGRSFGASFLGSFSLAYQIPRFLSDAVLNPLWLTLYVQALRSNDEERFQIYQRFARMAALILFPAATLGAAKADAIIDLFLGPSWRAMSPLFQLLLLTYVCTAIGGLGMAILFAKGRTSIQLRITCEMAAIRLVSVVAAPWMGIWVLWVGLPAANVYACLRVVVAACRSVDQAPTMLIKPLIVPAACAITVGLACWETTGLIRSDLLTMALEVVGSLFLYSVSLLLFDRQPLLSDLAAVRRLIWKAPTN
jgi:O-antigen/teichoic acid export membrane protein